MQFFVEFYPYPSDFKEAMSKPISKGERTQAAILDATIQSISKSGFDSVTYDHLGSRVGVTRQLVQKYFPRREDLLLAAFARVTGSLVRHIEESVSQPCDARERLKRHLYAHFEWITQEPAGARTLLAFIAQSASHRPALKENSKTNAIGRARIAALLKEIQLNGLWGGSKSPTSARLESMAADIQARLFGSTILSLTDLGVSTADVADALVASVFREINSA
jgi:AcrR family transcriptional regulator